MANEMSSANMCGHSTAVPDGSHTAARLSSPSLPLSMSANETDEISQGGRREHGDRAVIDTRLVIPVGHGQIGPPPRHGQHHAVVESDQHPRNVVAPEDPADATPLTA